MKQNDEKTTKMQNHGKTANLRSKTRDRKHQKKNALTSTGLVLVLYRDKKIFYTQDTKIFF